MKDCTFHPKITKLGKQMPQKTAVDRAYGDKLKQELAKEHAMLYWQQESMQEVTFQPTLIKTEDEYLKQVQSRLNLQNGGLETLLDKCREEKQRREEEARQYQMLKEQIELVECSHAPIVKPAPEYVRKIAQESRLIKEERRMIESMFRDKPDWQ